MSDPDSRCEKCELDIMRLQIELDALGSEISKIVGPQLARIDTDFTKVETSNVQMFADLRAQTEAGFASLRAGINAVSRAERKDDEPPKLN